MNSFENNASFIHTWKPFLLLLILFTFSCDEQRRIIEPFVPSGNRVVLLEEFTGKGCTNCPKGSREIENLLVSYPNNLIAVSIHAGFFANPVQFPYGQYDLRSPQAQDLLDLLGPIDGYPSGTVNRTPVSGSIQLSANQWASAITQQLQTEPAVELSISKTYNETTRELNVTVTGIAKQPVSGDLRLSIMLTESGIIDAQDDFEAGGVVDNYVHKHVLRNMLTPAAGAPLFSSLSTGQTFNKSYTTTLDPGWNPMNMEIVAFISNVQGSSIPILQATSLHLAE